MILAQGSVRQPISALGTATLGSDLLETEPFLHDFKSYRGPISSSRVAPRGS